VTQVQEQGQEGSATPVASELESGLELDARVAAALEGLSIEVQAARDEMPSIAVAPHDLRATLVALRDRAGFDTSILVTAVDHFPAQPRFELVYQLLSIAHNDRIRIRTRVSSDPGAAEPRVATVHDLWPGATFSERECYDMFGVQFDGHPDLRRLLMPEGYEHYPLRKDFPHQGIEPDRLYREWERGRTD